MTVKEVRDLDLNQLESQVKELKHELFNLKLQKTLGQLQNTAQIRKVKRDIARMKTILTEKLENRRILTWKETKEKSEKES
nr:50S ribosomal protein L29 [Streptobacillus moniliformis]